MTVRWRVHAVAPRSRANGPGMRYVIWTQGCTLGCMGCFNPATHAPGGAGTGVPVADLVEAVLSEGAAVEGATVSGGEPLEQPAALAAFGRAVKARSDLGIIVLTGYSRAEVAADTARSAAVADVDLVVAGRYVARRRLAGGHGLRGSDNKIYWYRTDRYREADLAAVPDVEVVLGPDGSLTVTGIPAVATGPAPGAPW